MDPFHGLNPDVFWKAETFNMLASAGISPLSVVQGAAAVQAAAAASSQEGAVAVASDGVGPDRSVPVSVPVLVAPSVAAPDVRASEPSSVKEHGHREDRSYSSSSVSFTEVTVEEDCLSRS